MKENTEDSSCQMREKTLLWEPQTGCKEHLPILSHHQVLFLFDEHESLILIEVWIRNEVLLLFQILILQSAQEILSLDFLSFLIMSKIDIMIS